MEAFVGGEATLHRCVFQSTTEEFCLVRKKEGVSLKSKVGIGQ